MLEGLAVRKIQDDERDFPPILILFPWYGRGSEPKKFDVT